MCIRDSLFKSAHAVLGHKVGELCTPICRIDILQLEEHKFTHALDHLQRYVARKSVGNKNVARIERDRGRLYAVSYTHLDVYKRQPWRGIVTPYNVSAISIVPRRCVIMMICISFEKRLI